MSGEEKKVCKIQAYQQDVVSVKAIIAPATLGLWLPDDLRTVAKTGMHTDSGSDA